MCLKERTKKRFKYDKQVLAGATYNVGYKVFFVSEGKLHGEWRGTGTVRPPNKWLHEKDFRIDEKENRIYCPDKTSYLSGWHIYVAYPFKGPLGTYHEQSYKKVLFKTPVAKGYQFGEQVVVAKWIYILP